MTATDQPCELVRAHHPSFLEPPFDASHRKLTAEEIQWFKDHRGWDLDSDGDVAEPEGGLVSCGVGRYHPNADVIRREKAEKAKAAAEAKKRKHRTYSDGSYRISKRSPEAARTELVVAHALRYAEDLKKKGEFEKFTLGMEGSRLQLERDLANQPPMPTRGRGRRVHFR